MTPRRVGLLLLCGVGLVVFAIWLASQRHLEHATLAGDLVLPGLEHGVNAVSEIDLRRGDGTHVTLKKDAGGWLVGERAWPAESGRVRKLLLDLGALNVVEEKTRLPANYAELGVEDVSTPKATGTEIDVVTPGRTFALIVGHTSSGKSGYVRVRDTAASLLAAPLLTPDADPKTWLDRALIDLPQTRVHEVEAKPADGPAYSVARARKEDADFSVSPVPKGRELTGPGTADSIAAGLASLSLDDVQKGTAPADAKVSHIIFRTFDGLEVDVAGRKDGSRSLIALTARATGSDSEAERLNARLSGWEFEIPEYKYGAMFRPLEDLLKPRPEPKKKEPAAGTAKKPAPGPAAASAAKPASK